MVKTLVFLSMTVTGMLFAEVEEVVPVQEAKTEVQDAPTNTLSLAEEELVEEVIPVLEDLAHLVAQPAVTVAELPAEEKKSPFDTLPISYEEKRKIERILMTLSENSVFKLLFEKKHLERLGHEVNHVHPIRFLGTVFSDQRLVYCLYRIRSSSFKWDGFVEGFSERFKEEIRANNVNQYIPSFAAYLNVKPEVIQSYINANDLEGLIVFLMETKANQ